MGCSPPASPTSMPSARGSNPWDAPKTMLGLRSRAGGWHEGNSTGLGRRSGARSALGCMGVTPVRSHRDAAGGGTCPQPQPRRASSLHFGRASLPVAYWRKQRDNSRKMKPNTPGVREQSAPKITLVRRTDLLTQQEQGAARALRAPVQQHRPAAP